MKLFIYFIKYLIMVICSCILILFLFKILSNSSSVSPIPLIFQVAYLNRDTFFTSVSSFKENLSDFFL